MNKFAIFIDFDGVMIREKDSVRPKYVDRTKSTNFIFSNTVVAGLKKVLNYLETRGYEPILVLSTSWIKYLDKNVLNEILLTYFDSKYIDDKLTFGCTSTQIRYFRIEEWLDNFDSKLKDTKSFFILDDSDSGTALSDFRNEFELDPSYIDHRTLLVDFNGSKVFDIDQANVVIDQINWLEPV